MRYLPVMIALASASILVVTGSRLWNDSPARAEVQSNDGAVRTRAVVAAAAAFLDSLSPDQRKQVQFAFAPVRTATAARFPHVGSPKRDEADMHSPGQVGAGGASPHRGPPPGKGGNGPGGGAMPDFVGERYGQAVWSNYPVSDVPRPGLRLGALAAAQRASAMRLLQTLLSPQGYRKVLEIMGSDQALSEQGQPFASGTATYTIAILGDPSASKPWMVEFGGHHLGLNIVIAGRQGVMTPALTGAQPAVYTVNGKTTRALAAENDTAFALLDALDAKQREQAILSYRIDDLVAGPGHAAETIVPEGLKASAMTAHQKALLMESFPSGQALSMLLTRSRDPLRLWPVSTTPGLHGAARPHTGRTRTAPLIIASRDRSSLSSFRHKASAVIQRCTSTPCIATQPTITALPTRCREPRRRRAVSSGPDDLLAVA